MNIFYVDSHAGRAARALGDKHVVKMILESCQMLSSAHRVLDGREVIQRRTNKSGKVTNVRHFELVGPTIEGLLYRATHVNHPSNVWARSTPASYAWLYQHTVALLDEYERRYHKPGKPAHKCWDLMRELERVPAGIDELRVPAWEPPPLCMPDEYKVSADPVECYREYYRRGKAHLHKWTNTSPPDWL
jgi:Pyrimidine dimer DNA glycosylase